MSFKSDYSEDTDQYIENIRAELEQHHVMEEESFPNLQQGVMLSGVTLEHDLFPRESNLSKDREHSRLQTMVSHLILLIAISYTLSPLFLSQFHNRNNEKSSLVSNQTQQV